MRHVERARGRRLIAGLFGAAAAGLALLALLLLLPGFMRRHRAPHLAHLPRNLPAGALARAVPAPSALSADPAPACPEEMVLVAGIYCPYLGHRCVEWLEEKRDRCARYEDKPWCEGLTSEKRFCIDRFEYPNQAGVLPVVMASWIEADASCRAEGKRLCTETEWTLACEGPKRMPYPYGFARDRTACNIDRPYHDPDFSAFSHDREVAPEVGRLDQRVPSGSMPGCVSPFGVYDMTGNVDEWVVNEDPKSDAGEDISGLKGGYWGPIRARCRPITNSHNRWFRFYQVGFRCCRDP